MIGSEIAQPDCISEAYCLQAESNRQQNGTQALSGDGPPQVADLVTTTAIGVRVGSMNTRYPTGFTSDAYV